MRRLFALAALVPLVTALGPACGGASVSRSKHSAGAGGAGIPDPADTAGTRPTGPGDTNGSGGAAGQGGDPAAGARSGSSGSGGAGFNGGAGVSGRGGEATGGNPTGGACSKASAGVGGSKGPTKLVPSATSCGAMHLALGCGVLYWTDTQRGLVASVATTGGATQLLVQNQAEPTQIVVSGTSLYWLAVGTKSVMTASLTGAAPQAVTTSVDDIGGFALSASGSTLYFSAGTKVYQTTAAPGGAVTEVGHEDEGRPQGLAVSGNLIAYPTDVTFGVNVMTLINGTPSVCANESSQTAVNLNCAHLAVSQGDLILDTIFIAGQNAYWADFTDIQTSRIPNPFGSNDTVAASPDLQAGKISAFTINTDQLYFADDAGSVYQAPLMPGALLTTIARDQGAPSSMVTDNTNLYWATDCGIVGMALE